MKKSKWMLSVFHALQLTMLSMIALDAEGLLFWSVWCVALVLNVAIDTAIREGY